MESSVNIVMLVRDRYRLTKQAIESLYAHTDNSAFSLCLVNDESEDFRVCNFMRGWSHTHSNCSVVEISNSWHVLSQAKNLGVYWSEQRFGRGDWLCICDNDTYYLNEWLRIMIDRAEYSEKISFRLWGGQAHPFHTPIANPADDGLTEHDCLAGTHWFMRWETWDIYGPFERTTAAGVCQSEDYAFTQSMRKLGARIGVIQPEVVIDTGITQTDGKPSPGADLKRERMIEGILYE